MLRHFTIWEDKINHLENSELKYLADTNYLIGKYSCGKEKILDLIISKFPQASYELTGKEMREITRGKDFISPIVPKYLIFKNPENNLHPVDQKKIPFEIERIRFQYNCQIFVSTNSPFVIASIGELTEYAKIKTGKNKYDFIPTQKVYVLNEGKIAHKSGEIKLDIDEKPKGRFGYWGKKANYIASQMLSSGLFEDSLLDRKTVTHDAPILILCEGASGEADAKIYNKLFETYNGRSALFISCQGTHELTTAFDIFRQIKNSMSANFELLMLRDRDHEFLDSNSIQEYIDNFPGRRVLSKRAIECYLYNSESAALLLQTIGQTLIDKNRIKLDDINFKIQFDAERGVPGNEYKEELKIAFAEATSAYKYQLEEKLIDDPNYKFSVQILPNLIKQNQIIMSVLTKDIFGGFEK
jgi:hypothetical protein